MLLFQFYMWLIKELTHKLRLVPFQAPPTPNLTGLYPISLLLHSWTEVPTPNLSLLSRVPFILLSDLDIPSWP